MEQDKLITLIISVYNEEEVLDLLYERLKKLRKEISNYNFEFLFIDDGSKDKSLEMIKSYRKLDNDVSYVSFARNFGKEIGMLAGIDYAKGDAVVFMDADLQDPPELIKEFIKYWEQGYDDVYAKRKERKNETFAKKITAKIYYRILSKLSSVPIQIDTGDFRLIDRRVVNALKKAREESRTMKSMFSWVGYNKKEVLFDRPGRAKGETKLNYKKLIHLAIDGITSLSTVPLQLIKYASMPLIITFIVYFIYIIISLITNKGNLESNKIVILLILFFGSIQALFTSLIAEYTARIFVETKKRPVYLVDEYNGEKEKNE